MVTPSPGKSHADIPSRPPKSASLNRPPVSSPLASPSNFHPHRSSSLISGHAGQKRQALIILDPMNAENTKIWRVISDHLNRFNHKFLSIAKQNSWPIVGSECLCNPQDHSKKSYSPVDLVNKTLASEGWRKQDINQRNKLVIKDAKKLGHTWDHSDVDERSTIGDNTQGNQKDLKTNNEGEKQGNKKKEKLNKEDVFRVLRCAKHVAKGLRDCETVIQAAMCDRQRADWDKYFTVKITATAFTSMNTFSGNERVPISLTNEMWAVGSLAKMTKMMGAMHDMDQAKWGVLQSNEDKIKAMLLAAKELAHSLLDVDLPDIPAEEATLEAAYRPYHPVSQLQCGGEHNDEEE
jgi:hypothetical protein